MYLVASEMSAAQVLSAFHPDAPYFSYADTEFASWQKLNLVSEFRGNGGWICEG